MTNNIQQRIRKPDWLKIRLGNNFQFTRTKQIVDSGNLHTICSGGKCPNQGECWSRGTATFLIAGEICTRSCKFCNTPSGKPGPLDPSEPLRIAQSVKLMQLSYAVITSVDRDDLPDAGVNHWVKTITEVKSLNPETQIEILIPDFNGRDDLLDIIAATNVAVIGHNLETVSRLTPMIRSVAQYKTSLKVLSHLAARFVKIKTGIMIGLGETKEEVLELMDDVRNTGCTSITIGQYLQPSRKHYPVQEYIHPDIFEFYKEEALKKGFLKIESAPLVRSSFHADR